MRRLPRWAGRGLVLAAAAAVLLLGERLDVPGLREATGPTRPARVLHVFDGDSFEVRIDGRKRRVRIGGIDAPERRQPWANRARTALRERIDGRDVLLRAEDDDRYGRIVAQVEVDGRCIACELVREGHAWAYPEFATAEIRELEGKARAAKRGLWSLPDPEPPWKWRRKRSD